MEINPFQVGKGMEEVRPGKWSLTLMKLQK